MSIEEARSDIGLSIIRSTSDLVSDPSATFNLARPGNAYSTQGALTSSTLFGSSAKARRPSKRKQGRPIKYSISTPEPVMSDTDIDKKRNKLGYQRISIACAHCRRRKIRCLVAENDAQRRCQNCIRLKKECVFYPVDQQSLMESKSQSSGKTGAQSGPSSTVSPSPPDLGSGRPFEERHDVGGHPTIPSNAPNHFQGVPTEPGSAFQGQGPLPQPEYGFRQQDEVRSPWPSTSPYDGYPHSSIPAQAVQPMQQHWHYDHAVAPGDFAPFPGGPMQPPAPPPSAHPYELAHSRGAQYWQQPQPPMRSMSYSHVEEGAAENVHHYNDGYQQEGAHQLARYPPPSLETQGRSMMVPAPGPHSAPMGPQFHGFPDQPRQYMLHGEHDTTNGEPIAPHPAYAGGWYPNANSFGPVDGEHHHPSSGPSHDYIYRPHQPG